MSKHLLFILILAVCPFPSDHRNTGDCGQSCRQKEDCNKLRYTFHNKRYVCIPADFNRPYYRRTQFLPGVGVRTAR